VVHGCCLNSLEPMKEKEVAIRQRLQILSAHYF